jgi:hypothetical protein
MNNPAEIVVITKAKKMIFTFKLPSFRWLFNKMGVLLSSPRFLIILNIKVYGDIFDLCLQ